MPHPQTNMLSMTKMFTNDLITEEQYQHDLVGVIQPNRERLIGRENIIYTYYEPNLGLTKNSYWKLTDMDAATVSMGMDHSYSWTSVAESTGKIPVVASGFILDRREMEAILQTPNGGQKLSDMFGSAAYKMFQKEQELVLKGWDNDADSTFELAGIRNWTGVNTETGASWATAADALADVLSSIASLKEDNHEGPYQLYVSVAQAKEAYTGFNTTDWSLLIEKLERILGGPGRVHMLGTSYVADGEFLTVADPGPEWGAMIVTQDATPEITYVPEKNHYICQVFEAFGLEQRDATAICLGTGA